MTGSPGIDAPIGDDELPALFEPLLGAARRIGVAASGGPDSTALLVLLHRWIAGSGRILHLLTVDHGLRAEARRESEAVAALAERLGHAATILTWSHPDGPPATGIQAAARDARYDLLATAAMDLGLDAVALAHTLDDQAETFLIRLGAGSGLRGLAGMRSERISAGTRFVRPLLGVPKQRLIATLQAAGIPFSVDPSNSDQAYLRARVRALLPALADIGLTPDRLAATAGRLARAAAAIDDAVADLERAAVIDHGGVLSAAILPITSAPDEVGLRLLEALIGRIRPAAYGPRAAALQAFRDRMTGSPPDLRRSTVAGVTLDPRGDRLWIYAESGRTGFPVIPIDGQGSFVWDGRFVVTVDGPVPPGLVVAAATGDKRRADLPKAAAASLPALRFTEETATVTALNERNWQAAITIRPLTG